MTAPTNAPPAAPSLAEQIAELYEDGGTWQARHGGMVGDVAVAGGADLTDDVLSTIAHRHPDPRRPDVARWELHDGSAIVTAGGAWDVGFTAPPDEHGALRDGIDCWCWPAALAGRHEDGCEAAAEGWVAREQSPAAEGEVRS